MSMTMSMTMMYGYAGLWLCHGYAMTMGHGYVNLQTDVRSRNHVVVYFEFTVVVDVESVRQT